eukprot:16528-Eustigmatos_ZCMA.PRE.1
MGDSALCAGLHKLYRSRSMYEFHKHQFVFDDKDNSEDYFAAHNPVLVLDRITKPTVYINANDVSQDHGQ